MPAANDEDLQQPYVGAPPDGKDPVRGTGFSFMDPNSASAAHSDERYAALSPTQHEEKMAADQVRAGGGVENAIHPMLKAYYHGQLAQTITFGVWWSLSSPIYISLLGNSGVGGARIAYNAAMCVVGPIAGGYAQKANVRNVLNGTSLYRAITYFILIPLLWLLFRSGYWGLPEETSPSTVFTAIFLAVVFLDGSNVALLNVVAIDGGGPDLLSEQHGIGSFLSDKGITSPLKRSWSRPSSWEPWEYAFSCSTSTAS